MEIRLIRHHSPEYEEMVNLRMDILRRPLGLIFTPEQLAAEAGDELIAVFDHGALIGCCVLTPVDDDTIQLRQMAVREDFQSKGLGRKILAYAEQRAKELGYATVMMHARNVALTFYKKCGYQVVGREFLEVSIPHHQMEKKLTD